MSADHIATVRRLADQVRDALDAARLNDQAIEGEEYDAEYWGAAESALARLVAELEEVKQERDEAKQRAAQANYNWKEAEADLGAAEADRDRLREGLEEIVALIPVMNSGEADSYDGTANQPILEIARAALSSPADRKEGTDG